MERESQLFPERRGPREETVKNFAILAVLLTLLTGCPKQEGQTSSETYVRPQAVAAPMPGGRGFAPAASVAVPTAVVTMDIVSYRYYPRFDIYQDMDTGEYWFRQGKSWHSGPLPPELDEERLGSSEMIKGERGKPWNRPPKGYIRAW